MNRKQILASIVLVFAVVATLFFRSDHKESAGIEILESSSSKSPLRSAIGSSMSTNRNATQATHLHARVALAIERFRNLPFRPEYGDEVFDDSEPPRESERQKWERHCRLRDAYTSKRIHEPAFLEIYHLMDQYGLADDINKLGYLNDIAYDLTSVVEHATDYSPELISKEGKAELERFLEEMISMNRATVANIFQIEADDELMNALMNIHPKGMIGDPNTRVEPGERIILN